MKIIFLFFISFTLTFAQKSKDWQKLFNGKNLDNWTIKMAKQPLNENHKNTFSAAKGIMRVNYDAYETFEDKYAHIFYKTPYSYFILDFEYKFNGSHTKGAADFTLLNSGVMFHSQSPESMSFDQGFPVSLEMQLLAELPNLPRHTGNLCTPGTMVTINNQQVNDHCTDSDSKSYKPNQWIKARLIVLGDSIIHQIIEQDTVLTYTQTKIGGGFVNQGLTWQNGGFSLEHTHEWIKKDGTKLAEGYIAFQAESHPVDFKNIKLLNLKGCRDSKAKNYKNYYLSGEIEDCKY